MKGPFHLSLNQRLRLSVRKGVAKRCSVLAIDQTVVLGLKLTFPGTFFSDDRTRARNFELVW